MPTFPFPPGCRSRRGEGQTLNAKLKTIQLGVLLSNLEVPEKARNGQLSEFQIKSMLKPDSVSGTDWRAMSAVSRSTGWNAPASMPKPSSERPFHLRLHQLRLCMPVERLARPPYYSVIAAQRRSVRACHDMIASFGGSDVPLVEYALFGSQTLCINMAQMLSDQHGCRMPNHDAKTLLVTVAIVQWRLVVLETLARLSFDQRWRGVANPLRGRDGRGHRCLPKLRAPTCQTNLRRKTWSIARWARPG